MDNKKYADQDWPPLVKGLLDYANQDYLGWHIPGHHFGRSAWKPWQELLGQSIFDIDGAAELPGLDNLYDPQGIILAAEQEAASFFGVEEVRFLVNGSTQGNLAVLLACCHEGDHVFVPRNCHQSVVHGLVLSGATPVYLPVHWQPNLGFVSTLQTEDLLQALDTNDCSNGLLVLLHPNYYGITGDLKTQIELAHQYGLKVMVDEAHGPHFCAGSQFPVTAIDAGADFAVASAHKTLSAFGQASWLQFRKKEDAAATEVKRAIRLVETTSPSYILLASLDIARYQLQQNQKSWQDAAKLGHRLREKINQIPGLWVPGEELLQSPGICDYDPTRLPVKVSGLGITGFEAKNGCLSIKTVLDMGDLHYLVYVLSPDDIGPMETCLVNGLQALAAEYQNNVNIGLSISDKNNLDLPIPQQVMTPRQAFFAKRRKIPLTESVGKIAGETITPYPPGIPLICPGEVIDNIVLESLEAWQKAGGIWPGHINGMISIIEDDKI